ncbi:hypothetical protein SFC43_22865 [Bacteroides sp. CR5/BHMF/2]|nr:hypothetical protein [Bacteroides sp. CR5/BHMF/2]
MQKWLLTIIIAILPVITACSKSDTDISAPEEKQERKQSSNSSNSTYGWNVPKWNMPGIPN